MIRVVVVGGGVSGLATAHAVLERDPSAEVTLLERAARVGGNIVTEQAAGMVFDAGPDSWVATKPQATALARRLGLEGDLIGTIPENRRAFIAWGDRLHPLPEGFVLGVPTSILPIITTGLFSLAGKARMAMEPFIPCRKPAGEDDDESIDAFIRRRLGGEVVERLVGPLLGGIYGGDAASLSMRATLPQFTEMEQKHGSLIHALKSSRRPRGAGPRPSMFTSLKPGLGALVARLVSGIGEARIRTGVEVSRVSRLADDARGRFAVEARTGEVFRADHVVMATPAYVAAAALAELGPELGALLEAMPYVSTAVVMMTYPRAAIAHRLDATGYIVPRVLGLPALATTWVTSKWSHRAPDGQVMVRVFLGGKDADAVVALDDAELGRMAQSELKRSMGLEAPPTEARVYRFVRANPLPLVGHPGRMRRTREILASCPGVYLVASGYDGVGIPDCVRQAEGTAQCITAGPTSP